MTAVLLVYEGYGRARVDSTIKQSLKELGNTMILASPAYQPETHFVAVELDRDIPRGPYFYSPQMGELYQAFRLYSDHQLAFTEACLSDGADGFEPLPGAVSVSSIGLLATSIALLLMRYREQ